MKNNYNLIIFQLGLFLKEGMIENMENASKALLIAAGALIAILILSLFSFLIMQMEENTANLYSEEEQNQNMKFNKKILVYEGRGTITDTADPLYKIYGPLNIQDVVTIINIAKDNNFAERRTTKIIVKAGTEDWTEKDTNQLLKDYADKKFKFADVEYNSTGLIKKVQLDEIP